MSFIIFSLPRSRSAWLSLFLSQGGRQIGHDIGADCESPDDFLARIGDGTCETGAMFAWAQIRNARPDLWFATVRRPRAEVLASLAKFGLVGYEEEMERRDAWLDEIEAQPGTLRIEYTDLATFWHCARLFRHCYGGLPDPAWWDRFDPLNIQVDMKKQLHKLRANAPRIEKLKADVRSRA